MMTGTLRLQPKPAVDAMQATAPPLGIKGTMRSVRNRVPA